MNVTCDKHFVCHHESREIFWRKSWKLAKLDCCFFFVRESVCGCYIPIMSASHPSSSSELAPVLQPNVSSNFPSVPRCSLFPCLLSRDRECQARGWQPNLFLSPSVLHLRLQTLGGAGYLLVAAQSCQLCVPKEQHPPCWRKNTFFHGNHWFPCSALRIGRGQQFPVSLCSSVPPWPLAENTPAGGSALLGTCERQMEVTWTVHATQDFLPLL